MRKKQNYWTIIRMCIDIVHLFEGHTTKMQQRKKRLKMCFLTVYNSRQKDSAWKIPF